MKPDYREFLRMLRREEGRPCLFEPTPSRGSISQIIWRAGALLFDTTEHKVETLVSFYENIKSDTVTIESDKNSIDEILAVSHLLPANMKYTVISNDTDVLTKADADDSVCAIASMLTVNGADYQKPLIYISKSDRRQEIEGAIERGAAGVYVPCDAEYAYRKYGDRIAVLGGMSDSLIGSSPVRVHARMRDLAAQTNGKGYAFGSGLLRTDAEYLSFISMLGMFNTLCDEYKEKKNH